MTLLVRYLLWVCLLANSLAAFALAPVITLIYPPKSAAFSAPAAIPLAVNASDPDPGGSVVMVEYFLGSTPLGPVYSPPFSATLNGVGAGTYTFTAKATDNTGAVKTSSAATVTVYDAVAGNTAPTIGVTPLSGSAYSLNAGPVVVPVSAAAADADAGGSINRVELFINGSYFGSVLGSVFNGNMVISNPGTYSIIARAYDNLGIPTTSAETTVDVYATVGGNTAPTSSLTSPTPGETYLPPATISIAATASDPGGSINRVEFYRNNSLLNVMTAPPYTFGLSGVAKGSYTFRARAYDNLGVYQDSSNITVVVNTPPTVKLTAPANNAVISAPASFILKATATDADSNLSKVEFYQDEAKIGEDTTSPYSVSLSNLPRGNYAYKAKAYDLLGAVVTSSVINVLINEPPTISLEADSIAGYNAPADIVLTALPADVDGTISKVEFYSESASTPLSTRTTPPYSHTVAGAPAGIYIYTAKVYDNRSAVTTSSPVSVTVSAALSPATFTYDELGRLIGVQH